MAQTIDAIEVTGSPLENMTIGIVAGLKGANIGIQRNDASTSLLTRFAEHGSLVLGLRFKRLERIEVVLLEAIEN